MTTPIAKCEMGAEVDEARTEYMRAPKRGA